MPHTAAGLGHQQKLLNSAEFKAVFSHKSSVHGKFFSVHAVRNSLGFPRLGLTVSRRVSKKAVQRNRIKRQIRESFRLNRKGFSDMDGACDYIVVCKTGGAEQENRVLREEIDGLWTRSYQRSRKT